MRAAVRIAAAGLCAALLCACAARIPPVPEGIALGPHAASLKESVESVARAYTNLGRFAVVQRRARSLGLERHTRSEWIDWFSFQRNLLIEVPGSDPHAGVIYVTAHYDKTDVNPLKFVSLLTNGLIDELTGLSYASQGAVDNGTGVAIALELAASAAREPIPHTLRVLLPGAEESGLRGTRAHVSRLSREERERVRFALNIDSVATLDGPDCVSHNVSDPALVEAAHAASRRVEGGLRPGMIPPGATSDFAVFRAHGFWRDFGRGLLFSLPAGLLPQRSWFTRRFAVPVANFSACELIDWSDWVGASALLPLGRLHGPRDRASRVDLRRLDAHYRMLRELIFHAGELLAHPPELAR
jgi:hypothetical protein